MSMELLAQRRDMMEQETRKLGMTFVSLSAPDPMNEGGLPATQQFVLEDVPRRVQEYGKQTAFFSTNCGMQDPLIKSVLNTGAYFPEQCCPSPTHGYVTALGISVPEEKAGDMAYINEQNKAAIASRGLSGHFATWPVPLTMLSIEVPSLLDVQAGKATTRSCDLEELLRAAGVRSRSRYDSRRQLHSCSSIGVIRPAAAMRPSWLQDRDRANRVLNDVGTIWRRVRSSVVENGAGPT
jgi:hypothetical protein